MHGQTKEEQERLESANKLFESGDYSSAYPLYLQLIPVPEYRLDPDVNFKYGTCLLHVTEDKTEALPYLNLGASKGTDPRAYFFLGKAYHLLYKFSVAKGYYEKFKSSNSPDKEKYQVDLHIRMCVNGKKLLNNLTELVVEQKTRTSVAKFPYSYDLSQIGGRIIISEEFQSKLDEKLEYRSMTYIPPVGANNDVIFYASYGKKGDTGLDLYSRKRLPNGDWGEEQRLPDHINTPYDDAYGFLHASKTVFYFCSKGHNSMGGYDVFKCSYDITTNTFGPPVNLDYKINTPDDDIMYVVDSLEQNAYFASGRASKYGFIDVYKVRVETFPLVNVLLAGNFENKIQASDNATIKIRDDRNDEIIGVYNPKQGGKYTILLPKSGTYTFIVETENSEKVHESSVVVPPQKEFKPLKQRIILTNESGIEQLIIQNLFDEEFTEEELENLLADAMQAMEDPEVNADDFEDVISVEEKDSILETNITLDDIEGMAKSFYEDAQQEADRLKEKMDAAFAVANEKSKEAAENAAAAEEILTSLDDIENPLERQQQADLAKELNQKAKDEYLQATTAYNLANGLKSDYERAQNEADESKATYESIQSTLAEKDHEKAIAQLTELKEKIESIISNEQDTGAGDAIYAQAKAKKEEANKALADAQGFRSEEQKLNNRVNVLKSDLEKAKEKDKAAIQVQIDELEEQVAINKKWAEEAYAKAEKLDLEASALDHQAQLLMDLDSELANSSGGLSEDEVAELEKFMANNSVESGIESNESVLGNYSEANENNEVVENNGGNESNGTNENNETVENNGGAESNGSNETNESNSGNETNETAENNGNTESNGSNETIENNSGNETNESNSGNETNEVVENNSGNESNESNENIFTAESLNNAAQKIVDEQDLKTVQNDPNLTAEEKIEKENEIISSWVDKFDYKIVEANKGLLETSDPEEREKFKDLRAQFEEEKSNLENRIQENNSKLVASNATSNNDNISEEYQELINTTEKEVNDVEDYSGDLSETEAYFSDEAAEKLEEKNKEREELIVKEQELEQLEEDYNKETKDKKKEKIQNEIDNKESEILSLKSDLGTSTYEVDGLELDQNDTELVDLIEEIKGNVENFNSDTNYLKAQVYNQKAEEQRNTADEKVDLASKTTDPKEKAELLEEAHALNTAAIDNQREAISLLENMTDEGYVASVIPTEKSGNDVAVNNGTIENNGGNEANGTNESNETAENNGGAESNGTNGSNEAVENNGGNESNGTNESNETAENNGGAESNGTNGSNEAVENNGGNESNGTNESNETAENNGGAESNGSNGSNETVENNGGNESNGANESNETTENNGGAESNGANGSNETVENNSGNESNGTNEIAENNAGTNSNNSTTGNQNKTLTIEDISNGTTTVENLLNQTEKNAVESVSDQEVLDKIYRPENDNPEAYVVSTEVEEISYSNKTTDFDSEAANEILLENEKVVNAINDLENEKTVLNLEAQNAQSEKDKDKIEKKVEKIDQKIAKQEAKLHEDIENITEAKVEASKSNLEVVKESFGDMLVEQSTNIKQSAEYESKGDNLVDQAAKLRTDAETEKDKTRKNEMLKEANSKELEASTNYDKAADLYVDAAFGQQEKTISKNQSVMSSEDLNAKSEELRDESSRLMNESIEHRDSALLAKGSEKVEMLQRAEEKEKQANTLSVIASEYKKSADQQTVVEQKEQEKESLLANLSPSDLEEVKTTDAYQDFYDAEQEKNQLKVQKAEKEGEKKGLENIVLQQTQDLKQLENDQKSASNQQDKKEIQEKISQLEDAIIMNEDRIDEIEESIESLEVLIETAENNQENTIASLPSDQQNDAKAIMISDYDKTPIKKTSITFGDLISSNFVVPDKVESDIIVMNQSIKYSDDNPIPLNPKYPDGLIYKVQVGAFSKPIPNDVFNGFAPITGEQVGNTGLVRYRVGYFVNYNNANDAKNEIRGFGYSDAFVVAIYNGEKISLAEARNLEQQSGVSTLAVNGNNNNGQNQNQNTVSENGTSENGTTGTNNSENGTASNGNNSISNNGGNNSVEVDLGDGAAKTNDADKIEGLFYTVQLGAFSNPIKATDVYNISPLVTKFIGNLYKYSTGIYRSVEDAVVRKNEVVALGNTDAFVTVYYNGERISVAKAQELIAQQGESIFATTEDGQLKQLSGATSNPQPQVENIEIVETLQEGKYFVDLGTYAGEIPTDLANAMLMVPEYTIQSAPRGGNAKFYYVGYFDDESDAKKVIEMYNSKGVTNLTVGVNPPETERSGPSAFPGVEYRIFLGTYQGEVPGTRGIVFVDLKDEGIQKIIEDDGSETYYAGRKSLYSEAESVKKKFTSRGVNIAEIKAFRDGEEIPVDEAKQLTNE
ncbi:MAG: hypothetical protein H6599_09285 [Flavobacteriales bacterium]|nr:hypothetical protein [Flavobacteriales bacterium]